MAGSHLANSAELIESLKEISKAGATKSVKDGLASAALIIQQQCKDDAPVRSGFLHDSIKIVEGKRRKGIVKYLVSTNGQDSNLFKGDAYYGGFINYGWHVGKRPGTASRLLFGDKRRKIEGTRFLNKAFDKAKKKALDVFFRITLDGVILKLRRAKK